MSFVVFESKRERWELFQNSNELKVTQPPNQTQVLKQGTGGRWGKSDRKHLKYFVSLLPKLGFWIFLYYFKLIYYVGWRKGFCYQTWRRQEWSVPSLQSALLLFYWGFPVMWSITLRIPGLNMKECMNNKHGPNTSVKTAACSSNYFVLLF